MKILNTPEEVIAAANKVLGCDLKIIAHGSNIYADGYEFLVLGLGNESPRLNLGYAKFGILEIRFQKALYGAKVAAGWTFSLGTFGNLEFTKQLNSLEPENV